MTKTSVHLLQSIPRRSFSMALRPLGSNDFIRKEKIEFKADGNHYTVDVVIQDTLPEGSPIGSVIATGGTPGSHRDFKYIANHLQKRGIRYVGVNFSGYGDTPWNPQLQQTWTERLAYVQAIVDKLELKENLVFLGHSMGTEPALKAAVENSDKTKGIVLPFLRLQLMYLFWKLRAIFGSIIDRIVAYVYFKCFNLRLREPHNVGVCLQSCVQADFPQQRPFVERFNNTKMKALIAYSETDPLIGMNTYSEFIAAFKDRKDTVMESNETPTDFAANTAKLWKSGVRVVDVNFPEDAHFVQKHHGECMAEAISALLALETPPQNKL